MTGTFVASTSGVVIVRDEGERLPIHNVPAGHESEFNLVTELKPAAVLALLEVFKAHNVECDPRNRATLIRNLHVMAITGEAIVTAFTTVCAGDAVAFAEQVFASSPQLAQAVHSTTGRATFAHGNAYHLPLGFTAPAGWR